MSSPISIHNKGRSIEPGLSVESCGSPLDVAQVGIAPTVFTTRRTRTISACAKIDEADLQDGIVLAFSRTKGHGFLKASQGSNQKEFFHVSDVNSQLVPTQGDSVKFRIIPIPPKYSKTQAVQVTIPNEAKLIESGRQTWADQLVDQSAKLKGPNHCPKTPPPTPI